jgi:hypothetical protein
LNKVHNRIDLALPSPPPTLRNAAVEGMQPVELIKI